MLTVFILDKCIFLRYRLGRGILIKYILFRQIKGVTDTFAEREFDTQYLKSQKGYYTFEFSDGTRLDDNDAYGVDLELENGEHFYIGFNGVEKFNKELKERIGMS